MSDANDNSDMIVKHVKHPRACGHVCAYAQIKPNEWLSEAIDLNFAVLTAVYLPENWREAPVSIVGGFAGDDGVVRWAEHLVSLSGSEVATKAMKGDRIVVLSSQADFSGIRFVKIRSGTVDRPVSQPTGAVVTLLLRDAPQSGPYVPPQHHG